MIIFLDKRSSRLGSVAERRGRESARRSAPARLLQPDGTTLSEKRGDRAGLIGPLIEHLPQSVDPWLRAAQRYLLPLLRRRVPLLRASGPVLADGTPGTLLLAGDSATARYLAKRFFAETPAFERIGTASLLRLPAMLPALAEGVDLAVATVPRWLAGRSGDRLWVRVPESVGARLEAKADGSTFAGASRTARRNIELVRKNRLAWSVSHELADFERFYDEMYVPFAQARYGELAFVRDRHALRRRFRQGGLFWIRRDGEIVAGQLFQIEGPSLHVLGPGTPGGSSEPVKLGALSALYLAAAAHAEQNGIRWLDMGGSSPSLRDGVLLHKRGWGAMLADRPESHADLLVRWRSVTPPVAHFLAETPLVVRDGDGFSAVTVWDGQGGIAGSAATLRDKLAMPGLRRLHVLATGGGGTGRLPAAPGQDTELLVSPPGPPESLGMMPEAPAGHTPDTVGSYS